MKLGKIVYIAVIILLVAVFAISAFRVGSYWLETNKEKNQFDELAALKEQAAQQATTTAETEPEETQAETTEATEETEPTEPVMLAEYVPIYEKNNDVVGWIKIEGTEIDYPVMQTPDRPNYYLKRDINRVYNENSGGCIYIREECDMLEPSDNITIYGHNMLNGSMFAALLDYENEETWEYNPLIFFDTLYDYHVYKIFAVFKTEASLNAGFKYHNMIDAEDEEDFDNFIATAKELAFYDTGITPKYGDKIICLSTCEYTQVNGRFVVAAVRIS